MKIANPTVGCDTEQRILWIEWWKLSDFGWKCFQLYNRIRFLRIKTDGEMIEIRSRRFWPWNVLSSYKLLLRTSLFCSEQCKHLDRWHHTQRFIFASLLFVFVDDDELGANYHGSNHQKVTRDDYWRRSHSSLSSSVPLISVSKIFFFIILNFSGKILDFLNLVPSFFFVSKFWMSTFDHISSFGS